MVVQWYITFPHIKSNEILREYIAHGQPRLNTHNWNNGPPSRALAARQREVKVR